MTFNVATKMYLVDQLILNAIECIALNCKFTRQQQWIILFRTICTIMRFSIVPVAFLVFQRTSVEYLVLGLVFGVPKTHSHNLKPERFTFTFTDVQNHTHVRGIKLTEIICTCWRWVLWMLLLMYFQSKTFIRCFSVFQASDWNGQSDAWAGEHFEWPGCKCSSVSTLRCTAGS